MNDIKIIFEDNYLIVLNKPAGVLVHPTEKGESNTLVDFLKTHLPKIEKLGWEDSNRPGIVHRLDKDTSGLIILAKTPEVLEKLQEQFKSRRVQKTYIALVLGKLSKKEGKIEAAITRGKVGIQTVREFNYTIKSEILRPAVTFYKTISQYKFKNDILTLLEVSPKTGRMHQIRTHLKYIDCPIIGDPLYNTKASRKISKVIGLNRQFLHAENLEFKHPQTNRLVNFKSPLPDDLENILAKLEKM